MGVTAAEREDIRPFLDGLLAELLRTAVLVDSRRTPYRIPPEDASYQLYDLLSERERHLHSRGSLVAVVHDGAGRREAYLTTELAPEQQVEIYRLCGTRFESRETRNAKAARAISFLERQRRAA